MVVVIFRSRLKPGVEPEIQALGTRMYELAARMPGYLSYAEYQAADGELLDKVATPEPDGSVR